MYRLVVACTVFSLTGIRAVEECFKPLNSDSCSNGTTRSLNDIEVLWVAETSTDGFPVLRNVKTRQTLPIPIGSGNETDTSVISTLLGNSVKHTSDDSMPMFSEQLDGGGSFEASGGGGAQGGANLQGGQGFNGAGQGGNNLGFQGQQGFNGAAGLGGQGAAGLGLQGAQGFNGAAGLGASGLGAAGQGFNGVGGLGATGLGGLQQGLNVPGLGLGNPALGLGGAQGLNAPGLGLGGPGLGGLGGGFGGLGGAGGGTGPFPRAANGPLPSCFVNPAGFTCCNQGMNSVIDNTMQGLQREPGYSTCNTHRMVQRLEAALRAASGDPNQDFEIVVSLGDFAQVVHFQGDMGCKSSHDGKFILAYGTPRNDGGATTRMRM